MMKTRVAGLSDLDDLQRLVCGFREVLGRNNPDDATVRENLKNLLTNGEAEFLLAIDDSTKAVGYIQQRYRYSLWLNGLEATLEDLYVSPESRRQGIGARLVEFGIERAREKSCQAIKLDTNEGNRASIELYEKLGFSSGSSRFLDSRQLSFEKTLGASS